eukprot:1161694-Pelagomonas_calceolata.AAC.9
MHVKVMQDPVVLQETGHSYERKAIENWFNKHSYGRKGIKKGGSTSESVKQILRPSKQLWLPSLLT